MPGSFVGSFLNKFVPVENSVSTWINGRIIANLQSIITEGVNIPVTDTKTLLDAVNYIYQSHLGGEDDGNYPDWVQAGLNKIKSGEILDQLLSIIKKHAFGDAASSIKFDNIFTKAVKAGINDYIYKIADSMGNDTNFTDDNDALIVLEGKLDIRPVIITTGTVPVSAPAIVGKRCMHRFPDKQHDAHDRRKRQNRYYRRIRYRCGHRKRLGARSFGAFGGKLCSLYHRKRQRGV